MKPKDRNNSKILLSDDKIVELYWNREERAIKATDEKYGNYLLSIAYNIVHDELDCEECLNDTYLGTWNSIPPARPTAFQAFISKIMRCIAINKFKANHAQKRIPSEVLITLDEMDDFIPSENPNEKIIASELSRIISEYLETLDENSATMFICRYYYSDKIDDIADMMKVHRSTVFRALSAIREGLKEKLIEEGLWYEEK
ncbi:MAG: RNA polymerase sigma factor [Ruminococcaceae bacterium]|nr:RNA polymerase sigma factor [Oscillospiraceae bacterium]